MSLKPADLTLTFNVFFIALTDVLSRRRQEIRRPLIGSEQRRRDKLRMSYHRLKNAVPTHNLGRVPCPRPSKMALLDRAATRINSLEKGQQQLLAKIREVEEEAARLRQCVHSELLNVCD